MKGTPTYTQHTVAWPEQTLYQAWHYDEILVSFDAKNDGGTYGELKFTFAEFRQPGDRGEPKLACEISVFTESILALNDERISAMLTAVGKLRPPKRSTLKPDEVIRLLESVGVRPSKHHLDGMDMPVGERNRRDAQRRATEKALRRPDKTVYGSAVEYPRERDRS